jgi:LPXTG-motif cell wall-anchored protein
MRILLNVLGGLCLLTGGVWFLQGINILPGSFMTGQSKWAIYGGLLLLAGVGFLVFANRRHRGAA